MINDDYEYDIAASMDDLETIEYNLLQASAKSIKFQKPPLPEIDENSTYVSGSSGAGSTSNISETFRMSAESLSSKLRKTALINSGTSSSSGGVFGAAGDVSSLEAFNNNNVNNNLMKRSMTDNNCTNKNGAGRLTPTGGDNNQPNNNNINNNNTVTGTRRKFIVTRMDSNAILRPEAENLRNMSAKMNAATIQFPCSAAINQRQSLAGLFASNASFEPHLDKRFFDTSLVEVRIQADSTQSLNVSGPEHSVDGHSIWERRNVADVEPKVNESVVIDELANDECSMQCNACQKSQVSQLFIFSFLSFFFISNISPLPHSEHDFKFYVPFSFIGIRRRWSKFAKEFSTW